MTQSPHQSSTLHVVTHRKWVADDFTLAGVPDVQHHLGLDLPDLAPGDAVWAPMEWMHRAQSVMFSRLADGPPYSPLLDLTAPGADFLIRAQPPLCGRDIRLLTAAEIVEMADEQNQRLPITDDGTEVFAKPANCKIERVPAKWYDLDGLSLDLIAAPRIPDNQPFLLTWDRLDLVEEHRLWVLDGTVVTSSPYLHHLDFIETDLRGYESSNTWYPGMDSERTPDAEAFGADVLDTLARSSGFQVHAIISTALPRAFTLDVGLLADGAWVIIEANPAWSSALYGADPVKVADCVRASSRVVDMMALSDPHRWSPDPYLIDRAARQRPLARA